MGAFVSNLLKGMAGAVCIFPSREYVPPVDFGGPFAVAGDRIFHALECEGPKIRGEASQMESEERVTA